MSEEESKSGGKEWWKSLPLLGDSFFGFSLGMGVFLFLILVGFALLNATENWDGHLHDRQGCVQVQEISGKLLKVDSCTGTVEEVALGDDQRE